MSFSLSVISACVSFLPVCLFCLSFLPVCHFCQSVISASLSFLSVCLFRLLVDQKWKWIFCFTLMNRADLEECLNLFFLCLKWFDLTTIKFCRIMSHIYSYFWLIHNIYGTQQINKDLYKGRFQKKRKKSVEFSTLLDWIPPYYIVSVENNKKRLWSKNSF